VWPQQRNQKPGCGFPQATICTCFCLQTGGLLSYEVGNKRSHELPMLRKQWGTFKPGDIFLGDKGFCSYYDVSRLKDKAVDSVITLARRIPVTEAESVNVLGKDDLLIQWKKPAESKHPVIHKKFGKTYQKHFYCARLKLPLINRASESARFTSSPL